MQVFLAFKGLMLLFHKIHNGMENIEDPDQTGPLGSI